MPHKPPITFKTNDGQTITVRRMLPADINQLVYIYRNLSSESLYQRFRESATNITPMRVLEEARTLAESGFTRGKGFIAYADLPGRKGAPIAGARYIRTGEDTAEVAITVCDAFQKKGVGSQLLEILFEEARKDGIRTLTANVNANNEAVLRLMSRFHYPQEIERYGSELTITYDLSGDDVNQTDANAGKATAPGPKRRIRPLRNVRSVAPVLANGLKYPAGR
jgi:acetyltransferase